MPNIPISGLPATNVPFTGAEFLPIVQGGATEKTTLSQLGFVPPTSGGIFFEVPSETVQYVPPANARFLYVAMCGGGGGAGGGAWNDIPAFEGASAFGGGGGGGGLRKEFWLPLDPRPDEILITVGAGGAGGAAGVSGTFDGISGEDGDRTEIVINYPADQQVSIYAGQGFGGIRGRQNEFPNGAYSIPAQPYMYSLYEFPIDPPQNIVPEYNFTSGGAGTTYPNFETNNWKGGTAVSAYHPSGGGAGGSVSFQLNEDPYGDGGDSLTPLATNYGGVAFDPENINGKDGNLSGTNTNNDYSWNQNYPSWLPICGIGGSGGGASSFEYSSGNGGNGYRGGGGGGGGGFHNRINPVGLAGNGGNGGNGYVIIYEFY